MPDTSVALQRGGGETPPRIARWCALGLAIAATGTAVCISAMAGWQRGGWFSERLLWMATGIVLVVASHVIPALCRFSSLSARCIGGMLWVACMAATCYGHAMFYLMSGQHAGQARAAAVAAPSIAPSTSTGRGLDAIAKDRAAAIAGLARLNAQRCTNSCPAQRATRVSMSAKLDALNVEAGEAARRERADDRQAAHEDRAAAQRDEARSDPVTARLAAMIGIEPARVDLLAGMAFALTLECVACFCWMLALRVREPAAAHTVSSTLPQFDAARIPLEPEQQERGTPFAAPEDKGVTDRYPTETTDDDRPVAQSDKPVSDVERLAEHVAAGRLRATVADIRRHLGCSQQKALALRRQLNTPTKAQS